MSISTPTSPPYSPLSWTTGYRASHPFAPQLHDPTQTPQILLPLHLTTPTQIRPIFPHHFDPPHPRSRSAQPPTPYYQTQLHLSRPPTIPNPLPHPAPTAPRTLSRNLIFRLAPSLLRFCTAVLTFWAVIPVLGYYIISEVRPYCLIFVRRVRELDWMELVVAFVVFFFLPQGPGCRDGDADVVGNGEMNMEMDPVYVIRVANYKNIGGCCKLGVKRS